MLRCPKCHNEVHSTNVICPNCGEKLVSVNFGNQKQTKAGRYLLLIISAMLVIGFSLIISCDIYYLTKVTKTIVGFDIVSLIMHLFCLGIPLASFIIMLLFKNINFKIPLFITLSTYFVDYLYHGIFIACNSTNDQILASSECFIVCVFTLACILVMALVKKEQMAALTTLKSYTFILFIFMLFQSESFIDTFYTADLYYVARDIIDFTTVLLIAYSLAGVKVTRSIKSLAIFENDVSKDYVIENEPIQNEVKPVNNEPVIDYVRGNKEDQISRIKELLDIGAITKDEFENKKKEILGESK